ncbi:fimbrial biogenesis chaperone [Chitinophaga parva]|nr:molecular chaperone [Chitinophaga parva]
MKPVKSSVRPGIAAARYLCCLAIAVICCNVVAIQHALAQGNLLVTPARVIFEGSKRAEELNLANSGKDTARYLISFVEIRMNKNGTFDQVNEPDSGQQFASGYLRFFPRSVVLGPNEAQVIKLQLTGASQLAPGEYRSHLYFRAVPDERPIGGDTVRADSSGINVKLTPVFGITIPVIIRVGETTASVQLSELSVDQATGPEPGLNVLFNRTGNASVYGDLTVDYISPQGKATQVAEARGLAVYTPNSQRYVHLILQTKPGINFRTGKLRVAYTTKTKTSTEELARAELQLR